MTKRRDNDLKERMKALRVSEPLKLNRDGLSMKSPAERKEAPQSEVPPLLPPQIEPPQKEVPHDETVDSAHRTATGANLHQSQFQNELPKTEATENEVAPIKATQNKVPLVIQPQIEESKNEGPLREVPQHSPPQSQAPHLKQPQIEKALLEPTQNEAPKNAKVHPRGSEQTQIEAPQREVAVPQGFFKLSHAVFSEPLLQGLSGDCFRLFLWISSRAWRYPTSGGVLRASVSYIEANTGMSHATISRGLKTLKEKDLVAIMEVDFKNGNKWRISSLACGYSNGDDRPPGNKAPQNEVAQVEGKATSKSGSQHLKSRHLLSQNEGDLRSIKNIKNIKEGHSTVLIWDSNPETETSVEVTRLALEHFETSLSNEEKEALIQDFIRRKCSHGYVPPVQVVMALAATEWHMSLQNQQLAL